MPCVTVFDVDHEDVRGALDGWATFHEHKSLVLFTGITYGRAERRWLLDDSNPSPSPTLH
jgi:hypothetical protein